MQMQSLAVGALVIVLAGGAAFLGAKVAIPPAAEPQTAPRSAIDRDVLVRLDEIDRRLDQLGRRIDDAERLANSARDAVAESAAAPTSPRAANAAPSTGPSGDGTGAHPAVPDGTGPGTPAAELTPEEIRAANIQSIHDSIRKHARTMVPEILRKLADTSPKAVEERRLDARIAAQQVSLAIGAFDDDADKVRDVFLSQSDRLAAEVGPLVREGLEKSDRTAVASKFEEVWSGMDREARELLGDTRFDKFSEHTATMRGLIRQVLKNEPK